MYEIEYTNPGSTLRKEKYEDNINLISQWPDSTVDMARQYSGYDQTVQWIWPDSTVDMARQ